MTPIRKRLLEAAKKIHIPRQTIDRSIKMWLKRIDRNHICPWPQTWHAPPGAKQILCETMFPRLHPKCVSGGNCPCQICNVEYVIKRAKEALK